MATNYFRTSPWQQAAGIGTGIGDSLSRVLIALPQLRAEQMRLRQEGELQRQRGGLYEAQAEEAAANQAFLEAKTGDIKTARDEANRLGDTLSAAYLAHFPGMEPTVEGGRNLAVADLLRSLVSSTPENPQRAGEAANQLLPLFSASPARESGLSRLIQTKGQMHRSVGANQSLVNVLNPEANVAQGNLLLNQGQVMFNPQGQRIAGVPRTFAPEQMNVGNALSSLLSPFEGKDLLGEEEQTKLAKSLSAFIQAATAKRPVGGGDGIPTFPDEDAARAAGYGTGDIIRLESEGGRKVQLD